MEFKRVDIKTGYLCNNNCLFCVQAHNKQFANKNAEEIRESLRNAKADNCSGVVFTGGEFTLRKDSLEIIKYAKDLGFSTIQLQSNGRMFSNVEYCKKAIRAGANEFSPALHGPNAEIHDYLTRAPGAFEQTTKGIKNLRSLGQRIIVNSVIVKPNYRFAPETAKLLCDLKVDQFQFAFVHAMGNALENFTNMVPRKSLVMPYLKKGIDIAIKNNVTIMIEAVPFCMMQGYEKFVSELYIPMTRIEERDRVIEDFRQEKIASGAKSKFPQCKKCKYDLICEGPWREYSDYYGSEEFIPIEGYKIRDPKILIDGFGNEENTNR